MTQIVRENENAPWLRDAEQTKFGRPGDNIFPFRRGEEVMGPDESRFEGYRAARLHSSRLFRRYFRFRYCRAPKRVGYQPLLDRGE